MAKLARDLRRNIQIDRSKVDESKRTVELAFSSEEPVERWGENEVLSHDKGDYDFSRVKDGTHPLLLGHAEHDPDSQIGVIESARVDNDKIARAIVRFGNSPKANEIFKDVLDGIRKNISVGYDRTGIVSSKKSTDGMMTTRYRWEPTHIAIVPVPADTTVGIGRSKTVKRSCPDCDGDGECDCADDDGEPDDDCDRCEGNGRCDGCNGNGYIQTAKGKIDSKDNLEAENNLTKKNMAKETVEIIESDVRADERKKTATDERSRVKEIVAITDALIEHNGEKNDGKMKDELRAAANASIQSGDTVKDFQIRVLQEVQKAKPAKVVSISDVTSERDRKNYSIMRGIQSCIKNDDSIPKDGLEREVHDEMHSRAKEFGGLGYEASGFQVPHDAPMRHKTASRAYAARLARDMQVDIFGQGGAFVPTQLVVPIIELLRNMLVLDKVGMRTMAGLQGNIVIPRQEAAATAYVVSEIAALTLSNQVLGQISLTPHRVGATQSYSKQFLIQSTPDAEAFLRDDLFQVIALQHDRLGINGQGAGSEPQGVFNTPGINSITFGATPTYKQIVQMETDVRQLNVTGDLTYVSTSATKGSLKTVAEALTGATTIGGSQNAIWKGQGGVAGEMNGWPAFDSQQIPNNQVVLGAWQQLIMGMWGGLDVVVEPFTSAANAEWKITINTWIDFAVRHAQAFTVSSDSGAQ